MSPRRNPMDQWNAEDILDQYPTKLGNSIPLLASLAPGFGAENLLLQVSGPNELSRAITLYVAVNPNFFDDGFGGFYESNRPIVGRLLIGNGGVSSEFEFDVRPAHTSAYDPMQALTNQVHAAARQRIGLTVVSFHAAAFSLYVRTDANLRTISPYAAAGDASGGAMGVGDAVEPFRSQQVQAWASYGQRPVNAVPITRTFIVSNGNASAIAAAGNISIPVPNGAKRVRIFRIGAGLVSEPMTVRQIFGGTGQHIQALAADNPGPVELLGQINLINLVNTGAAALTRVHAEFELAL